MQVSSLKQNQSAYYRSQATLFAYDIADRMRANMDEVNAGSYFVASGAVDSDCINYDWFEQQVATADEMASA